MSNSAFPRIDPLGDAAVIVRMGDRIDPQTLAKVRAAAQHLERYRIPGFRELVPAFATVTVYYDPLQASHAEVCWRIEATFRSIQNATPAAPRIVEIPVCYSGEFGPDLEFVARHAELTSDEVIEIHARPDYLVYMIGFAPGFPYLGGLPERIATPRRPSPRLHVPAGSVGIAGAQTGVYPIATPGGWQIIGRTPLALFRPWDEPPTLLRAGDTVRFRPIDENEYHARKEAPP